MVDKDKAIQLRLEGKTYLQIVDEIGCSEGWCKLHLKGIKQPSKDKELIEVVRTAGRSMNGVTAGEIKLLVMKCYPKMIGKELEDKVQEVRTQARRKNPDVVIRPYWMIPGEHRECTTTMLEYAQELWQFKEFLADKYRKQFDLDNTFSRSVVNALTSLSAGGRNALIPQGLEAYGVALTNMQDELDFRSGVKEDVANNLITLDDLPNIDFGCY